MRVMTCNIRTSHAPDGENGWNYRGAFCMEVIRAREPSIFAMQEVSHVQFQDFQEAFPDYATYLLRDGSERDTPTNTIFYQRDAFELVSASGYWLSATPHIQGSRAWGSLYVRLANWMRLVERSSGRELRLINTHLDIAGDLARYRQALVIDQDAQAYPDDYPQILTGDMNAYPDSAAIQAYRSAGWQDAWEEVHGDVPAGFTYHGFNGPEFENPDMGRIDYVLLKGPLAASHVEVVRDHNLTGHYPSDHYFVVADVEYSESEG